MTSACSYRNGANVGELKPGRLRGAQTSAGWQRMCAHVRPPHLRQRRRYERRPRPAGRRRGRRPPCADGPAAACAEPPHHARRSRHPRHPRARRARSRRPGTRRAAGTPRRATWPARARPASRRTTGPGRTCGTAGRTSRLAQRDKETLVDTRLNAHIDAMPRPDSSRSPLSVSRSFGGDRRCKKLRPRIPVSGSAASR